MSNTDLHRIRAAMEILGAIQEVRGRSDYYPYSRAGGPPPHWDVSFLELEVVTEDSRAPDLRTLACRRKTSLDALVRFGRA